MILWNRVLAQRREAPITIYSWTVRIMCYWKVWKYIIAICSLVFLRGFLIRCAILVISMIMFNRCTERILNPKQYAGSYWYMNFTQVDGSVSYRVWYRNTRNLHDKINLLGRKNFYEFRRHMTYVYTYYCLFIFALFNLCYNK